jgi:hypothetical protein
LYDWKTSPIRWRTRFAFGSEVEIGSPDRAGVDLLQQVDAAQQGRFPTARRADQADHFVWLYRQVDVPQHQMLVVGFVQAVDLEERPAHTAPPIVRRSADRASR